MSEQPEPHILWRTAGPMNPLAPSSLAPLPAQSQSRRRDKVCLSHPNHEFPFLRLDSLDCDAQGRPGVYQQLCLDACYALAGNREGRFCRDRQGVDPVASTELLLLSPGTFYYTVDSSPHGASHLIDWELVPNFRAWSFPIGNFYPTIAERMKHWNITLDPLASPGSGGSSQMSARVAARDGKCLVSGYVGPSKRSPTAYNPGCNR